LVDRAGDDLPLFLVGGVEHRHADRDVAHAGAGLDELRSSLSPRRLG
jgi:hypothetical protein